jgi:DNA-binding CsgD family transcriptional regulator
MQMEIVSKGDLTDREAEVLGCVCDAMTDKQIASALAISIKTVAHHIDHIHVKFGIRSQVLNKRVAILRVAMAKGLVRVACLVLFTAGGAVMPSANFPCGSADYGVPPPASLEVE